MQQISIDCRVRSTPSPVGDKGDSTDRRKCEREFEMQWLHGSIAHLATGSAAAVSAGIAGDHPDRDAGGAGVAAARGLIDRAVFLRSRSTRGAVAIPGFGGAFLWSTITWESQRNARQGDQRENNRRDGSGLGVMTHIVPLLSRDMNRNFDWSGGRAHNITYRRITYQRILWASSTWF